MHMIDCDEVVTLLANSGARRIKFKPTGAHILISVFCDVGVNPVTIKAFTSPRTIIVENTTASAALTGLSAGQSAQHELTSGTKMLELEFNVALGTVAVLRVEVSSRP